MGVDEQARQSAATADYEDEIERLRLDYEKMNRDNYRFVGNNNRKM